MNNSIVFRFIKNLLLGSLNLTIAPLSSDAVFFDRICFSFKKHYLWVKFFKMCCDHTLCSNVSKINRWHTVVNNNVDLNDLYFVLLATSQGVKISKIVEQLALFTAYCHICSVEPDLVVASLEQLQLRKLLRLKKFFLGDVFFKVYTLRI